MEKWTVLACLALLAGSALAYPGPGSWRRASNDPDRDVEEVEPVRGGGSLAGPLGGSRGRPVFARVPLETEERPLIIPFGISFGGGFGGLGSRRDSSEEDSSEELPGGLVSTGMLHPYFVEPMGNFMAQMAEMMNAMRRQMNQVLNRVPSEGTDFSKLGNTTSTTKVVDGHVITVNETVIGDEGDDSLIHIRVVDVHPSESPETAAGGAKDGAEDGAKDGAEDSAKDGAKDVVKEVTDNDKADKEAEALGSEEVTSKPNRAENEIPMKVGSEVDDLNA